MPAVQPPVSEDLPGLFRLANVGWYFEQTPVPDGDLVLREITAVSGILARRLGHPVNVLQEMFDDPDTWTALVQTFVAPMTAEMRAMVYCVVRGARVAALTFEYRIEEKSELRVTVRFGPADDHEFVSSELWDAEVLHHLGIAKLNGRPFIDGYFAFAQ